MSVPNLQESASQREGLIAAAIRGIGRLVKRTREGRETPSGPTWEETLVATVNERYERARDECLGFHLRWREILAFLDGNQYVNINVERKDLVETERLAWWEQREVFNHMAPIYETRIARISQMQPKIAVRPEASDIKHLSRARISYKLVDHADRERLDEDQRQEYFGWLEATGTVLLKQSWDPTAGAVIGYAEVSLLDESPELVEKTRKPEDPNDLDNAGAMAAEEIRGAQAVAQPVQIVQEGTGVKARALVEIHEGDVRTDVVPPFEIYPDSISHQNVEDCEWIIHARAYPVDRVMEVWGKKVTADQQVDSWALVRKEVAAGGLGYGTGAYQFGHVQLKDHVVVKEMWERPSLHYPDGRLVIVAGNTLLYEGPLPYMVGRDGRPGLPFVKTVCVNRPGCFFGNCVMERLLGPQRRYNAWRNRRAEYLTRVAVGTLIIEDGSIENLPELEENIGAPGTIIRKKRGNYGDPKWMETPNLPGSFEAEGPLILHEFTAISGVSETTRMSEAPEGVKSGVALDTIIAQDNTRLSLTVGNIETSKVKWAKQVLRLYKQFGDQGRVLRTVGPDNSVDVLYWDSNDITDDVYIETSALNADTPAQRKQMVMGLLQGGFFNDPETGRLSRAGRSKVLELLQYGNWEYGTDSDELQVKTAQRENHEMLQGALPEPKDYHDETLHISEHVKFMLSDEFREKDAEVQGALEMLVQQHIMLHTAIYARKMQAMAAKTAAPSEDQGGNKTNAAS